MTTLRRFLKLVIALALLVAIAQPAGAAQPAVSQGNPRLTWGPCPDDDSGLGMECASLRVPVDWDRPGGRTLTLMLARLPSDGPRPSKGSVLVNFGGPVGISIELMRTQGHEAFAELRHEMDIVTWDIRGGPGLPGLSRPNLGCTWRLTRIPPYPRTQAEFVALAAGNRAAAEECRARDPELFDNMDSASNARDVEAIRKALGERKVNFYGASYGGFIAQSYARLFPHRVRTMVLDGTLNHSPPNWQRELEASALDNERMMRRFFEWCAAAPACVLHGSDIPGRWRRLVAAADRSPIPAPSVDAHYDGRDLQGSGLGLARRGVDEWPKLAQAIAAAERGDASGFAPPPPLGPYAAVPAPGVVECLDWPHFASQADLSATVSRLAHLAPDVGATNTIPMNTLLCVGWPTAPTNLPAPLPAGLPPLLGAGNWSEYDATRRVLTQVPGSGGIYHDGPGHTLYAYSACARAHIDRYFIERKVPPLDTSC